VIDLPLEFDSVVLEAVDNGLSITGENTKRLIYNLIEKCYQVKHEQLPQKIELLQNSLEELLGVAATKILVSIISKILCGRLGLEFSTCDGWGWSTVLIMRRKEAAVTPYRILGN